MSQKKKKKAAKHKNPKEKNTKQIKNLMTTIKINRSGSKVTPFGINTLHWPKVQCLKI